MLETHDRAWRLGEASAVCDMFFGLMPTTWTLRAVFQLGIRFVFGRSP